MPLAELTLAVVGASFPNKGKRSKPGPSREFEILVSQPDEPIELRPEPDSPADANAIAVYSSRGIQIGYVVADRTILIRRAWGEARDVIAIFQRMTAGGALVRISLDGNVPSLPPEPAAAPIDSDPPDSDPDNGFWSDEVWPDE